MPMKPELERRLASLDTASAAEALVRGYGPEIFGFLVALLRDSDAADEAFAVFSEDVWRGLPAFKGEASYRTWAYLLARHAALRLNRADQRRRKRFGPWGTSAAEKVAWDVRSTTSPFLRTESKDALRLLRESLEQRERELLVLRVDRGLSWDDIAIVLEESAATLRKRFERTKEKLRTQAIARGLICE